MNLKLDEITKAVNGALLGPGSVEARGYSIDTRTLTPGDLFFAVKGPRFDGHHFLQQAFAQKAAAVVIDNGFTGSCPADAAFGVIRVNSPVAAMQTLAQHVRRQWSRPVIGVTGSAGKTTTKAMIADVLSRKFNVLRTIGSLNNELGVPLTLLRLQASHEIAVLEMGMSAKGEIRHLAQIAEPNEGLITNVNPVHLEFFDSIDAIAAAKAELIEGLFEPRTAYLNNDDGRVAAMARQCIGKVVTYGLTSPADFKVEQIQERGIAGSSFSVSHAGRRTEFVMPLLGTHNIGNALAAIAVGASHGVNWPDIQSAIAQLKPEKMRGQIIHFSAGFDVIDDSYNSNPRALGEMIRFMGRLQGFSRKIVVAGEMLELGSESAALHRECGTEAARAGVDAVVAVQGAAREMLSGASAAGLPEERLQFAADSTQAGEWLAENVQSGDVILIKGSRGVKLEKVLEALRAKFGSEAA